MIYSRLTFPEGDSGEREQEWFRPLRGLLIQRLSDETPAAVITFLCCLGNIRKMKMIRHLLHLSCHQTLTLPTVPLAWSVEEAFPGKFTQISSFKKCMEKTNSCTCPNSKKSPFICLLSAMCNFIAQQCGENCEHASAFSLSWESATDMKSRQTIDRWAVWVKGSFFYVSVCSLNQTNIAPTNSMRGRPCWYVNIKFCNANSAASWTASYSLMPVHST